MGVLLPLFFVAFSILAVIFVYRHLRQRFEFKDVNQPRSYPLIGHGLIVKPNPDGFFSQIMGMSVLYPRNPRMVLFWLGPIPFLMLYSAKMVEPILTSSRHLDKGFTYKLLEPWLGLSILNSPAEKWRPKRKLLTPTFHYDILRDFVQIFNEHAGVLVRKLSNVANSANPFFEALSTMTLCTLDIICETSMGCVVDAQTTAENSEYVRAVHSINLCIQNRMRNPFMWPDWSFKMFGEGKLHDQCLNVLHSFTRKVIADRLAELESNGWKLEGRRAFLDLLLEMVHKGEMSRDDIQAEVDTFMFEGHDTTSTGLSWALHCIGNYPDIQKKIQKELDDVLGNRTYITADDLSNMKYLECCLRESLRLYPSVPIVLRQLGEKQELAGTVFPKGIMLLLNIYLINRDPEQWENPEEFIPERFLPENSNGRHSFASIPFSAGSRNCIGQRFAIMEEKVIMAYVLKHFNIKSVHARYQVRPKVELILRSDNGLYIQLEHRRK